MFRRRCNISISETQQVDQEGNESRALPREAAATGFGFLVFVARFTLVALG